jgi:hypothetical protein
LGFAQAQSAKHAVLLLMLVEGRGFTGARNRPGRGMFLGKKNGEVGSDCCPPKLLHATGLGVIGKGPREFVEKMDSGRIAT